MNRTEFQALKALLGEAASGSISASGMCRLVNVSRSIVEAYIRNVRSSVIGLCLHQGLTVTDIAYDCLGEVFARDPENNFFRIQAFSTSLNKPFQESSGEEIFFTFKSLLARLADAQLARLYAQSDPEHSKIHRNIREALKESEDLELKKDFRGYVLSPRHADALDHLHPPVYEELEARFLDLARKGASIPELLKILYDILIGQSQCRRSVPLLDVVRMMKSVYMSIPEEGIQMSGGIVSFNGLSDRDIMIMREQVESVLQEKILVTYLIRGKIDRAGAKALAAALHDILLAWSDGEQPENSLLRYLQKYMHIGEQQYEAELRSKLEYLLKIARQEFANQLMENI